MTETKNKVVVTDSEGERTRTDGEIAKENEELEKALKAKTKKQQLEDMLAEKKQARKKKEAEKVQEEKDMTIMMVDEPSKSLNFHIVGVGQAGSRVTENFFSKSYSVSVINTALADLKFIKVPERNKLLLDFSLGGAGGDLELGEQAVTEFEEEITDHISGNSEYCDAYLLCISGAGGTGSGGSEKMVEILYALGKPVVVLYILGLETEGAQSKHNSIVTLSKLAKLAQNDTISNLIVVDNAKIESLMPNKSLADFWECANEAIVSTLDTMNCLSAQASKFTALDAMDFSRVMFEGDCSIFGMMPVREFSTNEEALATAMVMNLEENLLSSEFNIETARSVGVIITGSAKALAETPASSLEYGFSMLNKVCGASASVFRGIYEIEDHPDELRVYILLSGLGLPSKRVEELKLQAETHMKSLEEKQDNRATNMNIDMGKTNVVSAADKLHKKIKSKNSPMSKIMRNNRKIVDKRRR